MGHILYFEILTQRKIWDCFLNLTNYLKESERMNWFLVTVSGPRDVTSSTNIWGQKPQQSFTKLKFRKLAFFPSALSYVNTTYTRNILDHNTTI
jgi:hypothetical protein